MPADYRGTPIDRFVRRVHFTGTCWLWTGGLNKAGYGNFHHETTVRAHRWIYQLSVGPIPPGLQLDHLCRVRRCVNPDHLEPVTAQTNVLRGDGLAAINARKTHCVRGHAFVASNISSYVDPTRPVRKCLTCQRERTRLDRAKAKARAHA